MLIQVDGVRLFALEAGQGEPALVFIHGNGADHTAWHHQIAYFSRRRKVVAVDLRGHGESDKPRQEYTMAGFADDLAWLCGRLGLRKPVVIGHSMGGLIALELLARAPDLPAAIVAVDSPIVMPRELVEHLRPLTRSFRGPNYREAARRAVENMFLPTDDPARRARIVDGMLAQPQHVMASACEQLLEAPSAAAATAPEIAVPVLAIASAGGHMADLNRFRELCPRLTVGQTVGAGHFNQLEVPDQVNAMIERFLTIALPDPVGT